MNKSMKQGPVKRVTAMVLTGVLLLQIFLTGCAHRVVLTKGFSADDVFQVESARGTVPEMLVYLTNLHNQYETVFGEEVFTSEEGTSLMETVRSIALARLTKVKVLGLMAQSQGVSLTAEEEANADALGASYFASLNEQEIAQMQVTESLLKKMYREYMLADKVYHAVRDTINPEISDDEARTIRVESLLIRTYEIDGAGNRVEYSDEKKATAYQTATKAYEEIQKGKDFEVAIAQYNEDTTGTFSISSGDEDEAFEHTAFSLSAGEISGVVETPDGYRIVKCISFSDATQTEANKAKILQERKDETFGERYDAFAAGLDSNLNEDVWNSLHVSSDAHVKTSSFFTDYQADFFS